jgi:TDG/mug DNA glycosylase family protein
MPDIARPGHLRPSADDLRAAVDRTIPDIVAPGLDVLFCGINPGLYSGATGFHFARPGNRFWPALAAAGFTPRRLDPSEGRALLELGCGITNLVARTTATAAELSVDELRRGRRRLERTVRRYRPRVTAIVGITAYRAAFDRPDARPGRQSETLAGSTLWVLPNTSGLNAHHQARDFARAFTELRASVPRRRPRVRRSNGGGPRP